MNIRPKVAVFALTSCEGCSLMILNLEDELVELSSTFEFVNFREAMDERGEEFDIAIIDGAVTQDHEVERLKEIRGHAKLLIAMGACAVQGGLYYLRNFHDTKEALSLVYGEHGEKFSALAVTPLCEHVKVDYNLYGCPMDKREFLEVMRSALVGKRPDIPGYPVCNECRAAENICVFERGLTCFGPVTRAGCGAICPAHGSGCCGCRGLADEAFVESHGEIMVRHGTSAEELVEQFRQFNAWWAEKHG